MQGLGLREETEPKGQRAFKCELKLNFEEGGNSIHHWNYRRKDNRLPILSLFQGYLLYTY